MYDSCERRAIEPKLTQRNSSIFIGVLQLNEEDRGGDNIRCNGRYGDTLDGEADDKHHKEVEANVHKSAEGKHAHRRR